MLPLIIYFIVVNELADAIFGPFYIIPKVRVFFVEIFCKLGFFFYILVEIGLRKR